MLRGCMGEKQSCVNPNRSTILMSRRKSCPDNAVQVFGIQMDIQDKRRGSNPNGFLSPGFMSGGDNSMGGFTGEWVHRGGWQPFIPPQPECGRFALSDLRHPGLDCIRFASYRTAAKLRYVQKRTNMHLIDIWNVIEAFRENGLNTLDPHASVKVSRLETLLSTIYHSLNKRLPGDQHINMQASTSTLLNWLLAAYDGEFMGQLRVFSVKVALATMCNSKPLDKLRYMFSQISDGNGHLALDRFSEYLHEVLALPAAVYESPSFSYSPELVGQIFDGVTRINVNDFLDVLLGEPGPECISWLPLLHRLAVSETTAHLTTCDACRKENITGLRYKCDQCYNYNLCQDCFWLGRISAPHSLSHPVKEFLSFNPSQRLGASVRRTLQCVPDRPPADRPRFPEIPERTLDLSHIVPPSQASLNGIEEDVNGMLGSCDTWSSGRSLSLSGLPEWSQLDEEHRLIAHYAACLAGGQTTSPGCESTDSSQSFDPHKTKRDLVLALERKNKEITRQINKIREEQEKCEGGRINPGLVSELRSLRSHRTQLEGHLITLQDSRKSLLGQLEGLMKLLKSNHLQQQSPKSSVPPNSSSTSASTTTESTPQSLKSPPHSTAATVGSSMTGSANTLSSNGHRSAPPTPSRSNHYSSLDSLASDPLPSSGLSSLRSSFSGSLGHPRSRSEEREREIEEDLSPDSEGEKLRNDLLLAADSVTNAMSSLVRDLNSESSEDESQVKLRRSLRGSEPKLTKWGSQGTRPELNGAKPESASLQRRSQRSASCGGVRIPSGSGRDSWSEPPAGLLKR